MAEDKLLYFNVRARAEAIRMVYAVAGKQINEERVSFTDWPARKTETPTGQIPVLTTPKGQLNESNTIARYVAKQFGLAGEGLWEEALHDMVVENGHELINEVVKIYRYKKWGNARPDDADQIEKDMESRIVRTLNHIQKVAESRGTKFIVNDQIGLGDVYLYASLEFLRFAFPDIMSMTEWTKTWSTKVENEDKMKKHLSTRPASENGL